VIEGEDGDYFYIIKEGEAVVHQSTPGGQRRKVNHLFRADFFGERALLVKEPRIATVSGLLCCFLLTDQGGGHPKKFHTPCQKT
jgi:cGMP-dependent protein kinase 2